jgi:hypothetical protein
MVTLEPRGQIYTITYAVFPYDLQITAVPEDPDTIAVKRVSHNPATGTGTVEVIPLKENTLYVPIKLTAQNLKDAVNEPRTKTVMIRPVYQNVTMTPMFETMKQGSFSQSGGGGLVLGDGEEAYFYLDIAEKNAAVEDIKITWKPKSHSDGHGHYYDHIDYDYYQVNAYPVFTAVSLTNIPQRYSAWYSYTSEKLMGHWWRVPVNLIGYITKHLKLNIVAV